MVVRLKAGCVALAIAAAAGAVSGGCDRCYDVPAARDRWLDELRGTYDDCDMALHVDDVAATAAVTACLLDHFQRCEEARGTMITASAAGDDWEYRDVYVLDTCEVVVLAFEGEESVAWRESICGELEAAAAPRHVEVARCSDRLFDPC